MLWPKGHSWGGVSRTPSNHPALASASAASPYPRREAFSHIYVVSSKRLRPREAVQHSGSVGISESPVSGRPQDNLTAPRIMRVTSLINIRKNDVLGIPPQTRRTNEHSNHSIHHPLNLFGIWPCFKTACLRRDGPVPKRKRQGFGRAKPGTAAERRAGFSRGTRERRAFSCLGPTGYLQLLAVDSRPLSGDSRDQRRSYSRQTR